MFSCMNQTRDGASSSWQILVAPDRTIGTSREKICQFSSSAVMSFGYIPPKSQRRGHPYREQTLLMIYVAIEEMWSYSRAAQIFQAKIPLLESP